MISPMIFRRHLVGILGASATLLLHSLLFIAAVWGDGTVELPAERDAYGAGANTGTSDGAFEQRLIIIQLQHETAAQRPLPLSQPILAQIAIPATLLQITGPDVLPLQPLSATDPDTSAAASEAELISRVKLQGLYEGQIRARIERAWLRPREPTGGDKFACRVLIRQRANGEIREVELQQCNGSDRWQKSLTDAIFAANPLPAPPNPAVFAETFSMRFDAVAYSADQRADLFEPETSPVAVVASATSTRSANSVSVTPVDSSSQPAVLYLNSKDGRLEWSTTPPPRSSASDLLVIEPDTRIK